MCAAFFWKGHFLGSEFPAMKASDGSTFFGSHVEEGVGLQTLSAESSDVGNNRRDSRVDVTGKVEFREHSSLAKTRSWWIGS